MSNSTGHVTNSNNNNNNSCQDSPAKRDGTTVVIDSSDLSDLNMTQQVATVAERLISNLDLHDFKTTMSASSSSTHAMRGDSTKLITTVTSTKTQNTEKNSQIDVSTIDRADDGIPTDCEDFLDCLDSEPSQRNTTNVTLPLNPSAQTTSDELKTGSSKATQIMTQTTIPPTSSTTVDYKKKIIFAGVTRLIGQLRTMSKDVGFPSDAALSILTLQELNEFAITQMFILMTGEYRNKDRKNIEEFQKNQLVKFGKISKLTNMAQTRKFFDELAVLMKYSDEQIKFLSQVLGGIELLNKQTESLNQEISSFYDSGKVVPTSQEVKTYAKYILGLQKQWVGKLNTSLKLIEAEAQRKIATQMQTKTGLKNGRIKSATPDRSANLNGDLARYLEQFSIYSSVQRERLNSSLSDFKDNVDDAMLATLVHEQNDVTSELKASKNPFMERSEEYLTAVYEYLCLNGGVYFNLPAIDIKVQKLLTMRSGVIQLTLSKAANIVGDQNELTYFEFANLCTLVLTDIKEKKNRSNHANPHYAELRSYFEHSLTELARYQRLVLTNGCKDVEAYVSSEDDLRDVGITSFCAIFKAMTNTSISRVSATTLVPLGCALTIRQLEVNETNKNGYKKMYLDTARTSQAEIYGSESKADISNYTSLDELEAIKQVLADFRACNALLTQMSPFFAQCHDCLTQLTPSVAVIEERDWTPEIEAPRKVKHKRKSSGQTSPKGSDETPTSPKGSDETPTSPKDNDIKANEQETPSPTEEKSVIINEITAATASNTQNTEDEGSSSSSSPKAITPKEYFKQTRDTLTYGLPKDITRADARQLYSADAAYHLFHAGTLLEMIEVGSKDDLRLFVPELVNAVNLVEEQVVTPIYIANIVGARVTHDLAKMSTDLKVKAPFIYSHGSESFRYPHAQQQKHSYNRRNVPKWLDEIVILGDKQEFAPGELLSKTVGRTEMGLTYATSLIANAPAPLPAHLIDTAAATESNSKLTNAVANPKVTNLLNILAQAEARILNKNNPALTRIWMDLKIHANRLKQAEELLRTNSKDSYLSIYAKSIIMSSQYFIEHCGLVASTLTDNQTLYTHNLTDYARLYRWNLNTKNQETLKDLNIEKGSDYPNWTIWNHKNILNKKSKVLELLNSTYQVSTFASENGEGFSSASKIKNSPTAARTELINFTNEAIDLMTAVANHL